MAVGLPTHSNGAFMLARLWAFVPDVRLASALVCPVCCLLSVVAVMWAVALVCRLANGASKPIEENWWSVHKKNNFAVVMFHKTLIKHGKHSF